MLVRLLKEPVFFDREGGLVSEAREQRDLVRPEAPALLRVHVENADDAAVGAKRHAEEAVEPELDRRPLVTRIVTRVIREVLDRDRLTRRDHRTAQALTHGDAWPGHHGCGGFGPRPD